MAEYPLPQAAGVQPAARGQTYASDVCAIRMCEVPSAW